VGSGCWRSWTLDVVEVMRCLLLCMLETVEGRLCLPELLDVLYVLDVLGVMEVVEVMRCVLL